MTRAARSTQILIVLAVANLVGYAARNALFAVYPELKVRYGIGDGELGLLQTLFMIPHAAATLPFGWAGDRFDRRRVIAIGLGIASIAGALGAIGTSYAGLGAARALVGLGTAAVVPVANSILGQIFDGPHKASRMSIFNLGLFLGGVVGFAAGVALGFPLVVVALAVPGLVLSVLIARLPVPPPEADAPAAAEAPDGALPYLRYMVRRFAADARELLRIPTLRWVIVSTTAMAFAAGGYNAWLQEFLVRDKGMTKDQAASLLAIALFGGLSGILVGGRVADRLRARTPSGRLWTIVMGMAGTVPCAVVALEIPAGPGLYAAGIATLFFISWYHAPMAASVDDLAPPGLAVAAQGLVIFTMHMVGTAPSSWVVGAISEELDLHAAMWVPTGGLVIAAACMAAATRTFPADAARARGNGTDPLPSL
ncbi:MAG: MFS transporter [Deltaproteobacteria bacterium]|nr:MFS transporter [Deltaproteobacteria bacterium]